MNHLVSRKTLRLSFLCLLLLTLLSPQFIRPAYAQEGVCTQPFQPVATPLTDLGDKPYVRMDGQVTTYTGGLYPNGSNTRPPEHEAAGLAIASQIVPLNKKGQPDPKGNVVMVSVGMSNASSEYFTFISQAQKDPAVNPRLAFINGAQGGQTAERWVEPGSAPWHLLLAELDRYGYTPEQVQVAWVKQTLTRGGDFPAKANTLETYLEQIAKNLEINFPNIKIAYFSSRTRSYTYWRGLSPEPSAYETGFSVKWLIEKQINGDPELNYDPAKGDVKSPYLSWGPYFWIDGTNPRSDGRVWTAEDMIEDCTHPSKSGREKVAEMMLEFFKSDTVAASWFLAGGSSSLPSLPSQTPASIQLPTLTATTLPPSNKTPIPSPLPSATPVSVAEVATPLPTTAPVLSRPATVSPYLTYGLLIIGAFAAGLAASWFFLRKN
jgi:hypothetical protein